MIAPEDPAETEPVFQHLFQFKIFPSQPKNFPDTLDDQQQLVHLKRLGDVVVCPQLDRTDRRIHRPMGGNQDDFRRRTSLLAGLQNRQAVGAGEAQVGNHDIELTRPQDRQALPFRWRPP
jgi:hypothetical protein